MISSSSEICKDFIQMKQDDKFYSTLISRESSSANPSLGVYYGDAKGAVPFLWESQPGTPKNTISNTTLPPLTPPPSSFPSPRHDGCKKSTKTSLIHTLLPKLTLKVFRKPSSSSSSKTSDEESRYGSPTPTSCFRVRHGAAATELKDSTRRPSRTVPAV
ncbi:unnamed protein product [Musa acuminata subsp. burmannicoides]